MSTGPQRVRIDLVGITDMVLAGERLTPFFDLERAIKARLAEAGTGFDSYADAGYGGFIAMSCADAGTCYDSIEAVLLASPLCEGATAVLILGAEDDAEQIEFPVGARPA